MARVKDMLIERIEELSDESGYDFEELMELWFDYCDECQDDGKETSWEYFAAMTTKRAAPVSTTGATERRKP